MEDLKDQLRDGLQVPLNSAENVEQVTTCVEMMMKIDPQSAYVGRRQRVGEGAGVGQAAVLYVGCQTTL